MVRLQQQTTMPFIMQQTLHIPPASIAHRFCTMLQESLSSHEQVIFMPPVHFSTLNVHRGTITILATAGIPPGAPAAGPPMLGIPIPCMPIPVRSIMTLAIALTPFMGRATFAGPPRGQVSQRPTIKQLRNRGILQKPG
jgi:hypothetical protein